ncbi:hypothetical protein CEXT_525791 [Caerostris extrusa]|uniref:Uncharacterized protein n=1 Tax=Caerostris extrusa TaxID=172846 RepID=A0AAV4P3F8_CAEEX|nr:hypothetical protein CEXT_525791 [Caerostris extrusa]
MRSRATTASPQWPSRFSNSPPPPPSISRTVNPPLGRREKTIFFHPSVALRIATSPVRIRTAQKFVCSHGTRPRSTSGLISFSARRIIVWKVSLFHILWLSVGGIGEIVLVNCSLSPHLLFPVTVRSGVHGREDGAFGKWDGPAKRSTDQVFLQKEK